MSDPDDSLLDAYNYAADALLGARLHAADIAATKMMNTYGGTFGPRMVEHQKRVADDGANFLRHLGYSDQAAKNFQAAMLFHDIGKTHPSYDPASWLLDDRPTAKQKAARVLHARLGAEMFAKEYSNLQEHPHFTVRHAVTLYHHERLDGTGPEKRNASTLPRFVQISCIVDAYDGDRIPRPHQERQRTPLEALERMADPHGKYKGAFDADLLASYTAMKKAELKL